jgi:hypothetical protein
MPKDLPATIPVRPNRETPVVKPETVAPSPTSKAALLPPTSSPSNSAPALPAVTIQRTDLAVFVRFASRLASRDPMPALQCSFFSFDSAIVTDFDVALRARLPGARDIGVLVPVAVLKRCLLMHGASEVRIERAPSVFEHPFMFAIGDAFLPGHDPAEFPGVAALFPTTEPIARAKFATLESVLVAASNDETRKSFYSVLFPLCRNLAVATNGHVLHTTEILSGDEGDFLVPRNAIELVENIRKATKSTEVQADFFEPRSSCGSTGSRSPRVSRQRSFRLGKMSFPRGQNSSCASRSGVSSRRWTASERRSETDRAESVSAVSQRVSRSMARMRTVPR